MLLVKRYSDFFGCKEEVAQTKQNQYFVASEHAPAAAPVRAVARGQRKGSVGPYNGLFLFGQTERNKIKILLRLKCGYDIMRLYKGY